MDTQTRSTIFSAFNRARAAQRAGKLNTTPERLNKALGLCLSGELEKYHTTTTSCTCTDRIIKRLVCKHMDARMIIIRAFEYMERDWEVEQKLYNATNGDVWAVDQIEFGKYTLHIFEDAAQAAEIMRTTGNEWRRPAQAVGTRIRPDVDHVGSVV